MKTPGIVTTMVARMNQSSIPSPYLMKMILYAKRRAVKAPATEDTALVNVMSSPERSRMGAPQRVWLAFLVAVIPQYKVSDAEVWEGSICLGIPRASGIVHEAVTQVVPWA